MNPNLENAVLTGRFDKKIFDLPITLIFGEECGMFGLLNNLKND